MRGGGPILARTLRKSGNHDCRNRKETNRRQAKKIEALNYRGSAAPIGPQQTRGSGMSHRTRMGPNPALTQILSHRGKSRKRKIRFQQRWILTCAGLKFELLIGAD